MRLWWGPWGVRLPPPVKGRNRKPALRAPSHTLTLQMWGVAVQLSRGRAAVNAREGGAALRCSEVELLPPPHCSAPGWVFPRGHQQPVPLEAHSGQGCVGRSGPAPSLGFKGHGSNLEAGVWVTARVEGQQCRPAGCASTSGRGPGRALPTAAGKAPALPCNVGDPGSIPGSGRSPRERKWQPTPVFLPGESQGRWSLVGCRLWGHTESDMTEAT